MTTTRPGEGRCLRTQWTWIGRLGDHHVLRYLEQGDDERDERDGRRPPKHQPTKPWGFCDCQRQVSAAISSTDLVVLQPSSRLALDGSA
jgi:hypothetical protein